MSNETVIGHQASTGQPPAFTASLQTPEASVLVIFGATGDLRRGSVARRARRCAK